MQNPKEKPILFNTEMVQAILDGIKIQTRRIIKDEKFYDNGALIHGDAKAFCPYGGVGDILWVREAWRCFSWHEGDPVGVEYKDGKNRLTHSPSWGPDYEEWEERMIFQSMADYEKAGFKQDENGIYLCGEKENPTRWRPSIHMPRFASRIQLKINNIKIERVQDITEYDCESEGVSKIDKQGTAYGTAKIAFMSLWDRINFKRGFGWTTNPWVWVVEFEKIHKSGEMRIDLSDTEGRHNHSRLPV